MSNSSLSPTSRLSGQRLSLGYDGIPISNNLNITIPTGRFTAIIGPNGCGKSTLLKTLCRLNAPISGDVYLDNTPICDFGSKYLARQISLLPQTTQTPDGITVRELVSRGRYPHQSFFQQWNDADETAVTQAMQSTGIASLCNQKVNQLSGGQRQRAWIATSLAQDTHILFLDEPTTYLDLTHQLDILKLCRTLIEEQNKTVVAVLHDLNQACRYADHLIMMKSGEIQATGTPRNVITATNIEQIFNLKSQIISDPVTGTPLVIPF
ncbi:ABC transporter ATP-binding protein [Vibrio salinus]|uniref:ABC transporter ATP-binding protein n=1 Tax=Vibrio salinus TaxID=2899784 RepID=UPI001E49B2C0|nr:ABC transporter ATP-binding protein [Vibrio salinus]MCE0493098.1 ABC transporter ATP-binding protein [Vibrio salinus]